MAEADLTTYQLQLQQVEAALTIDPDSAELLKLKDDLIQVIDLTKELIASQAEDVAGPSSSEAAPSHQQSRKRVFQEYEEEQDDNEESDDLTPVKDWKVGDECLAIWAKDGQYYSAVINEITASGQASVTFAVYGNPGVTNLGLLKLPNPVMKATLASTAASIATKKEQLAKQKEYLKKRKLKKQERYKKLDEEREGEKSKWQNFSNKAFGKKGFAKKSIFKTPENAGGRVGIGTCGVSGKEMTTFSSGPKHRKGI